MTITPELTNRRADLLAHFDLTETSTVHPGDAAIDALITRAVDTYLDGWRWQWSKRAKTQAGACRQLSRLITLSFHVLGGRPCSDLLDTLLHEIAHALAGHSAGHGPEWKRIARAIGDGGERCHNLPTAHRQWLGTCPNGHTVTRHRRDFKTSCNQCLRYFDPRFRFTWTPNTTPSPEPTAPVASAAELSIGAKVRVVNTGGHALEGRVGTVTKINTKTATTTFTDPHGTYRIPFRALALG